MGGHGGWYIDCNENIVNTWWRWWWLSKILIFEKSNDIFVNNSNSGMNMKKMKISEKT